MLRSNATEKKHVSMGGAEKAVTLRSGRSRQPILLGNGVVQQLPLGCSRSFYAF